MRSQQLDAAVIDLRSMVPSVEPEISHPLELEAGFLVRRDHSLARAGRPVTLRARQAYPVASTPLSGEVGRLLVERLGAAANPDDLVTLRCDETSSLVELARHADVAVLTVDAVAPDLVRLDRCPALAATARFGLVTLGRRQPAPALRIVGEWLAVQAGSLGCGESPPATSTWG